MKYTPRIVELIMRTHHYIFIKIKTFKKLLDNKNATRKDSCGSGGVTSFLDLTIRDFNARKAYK